MSDLSLRNVSYKGTIYHRGRPLLSEEIERFDGEFQFGKSYLLNAPVGKGAWLLSWMIAGEFQPKQSEIELNRQPFSSEARKSEAWLVRFSEIKQFGFLEQSVKAQIRHGLKNFKNPYLKSEREIIDRFKLSSERYDRPLRQLSSEGWRASCAIGLANGRHIFCFPHIEYLRPKLIEEYRYLWFEEMLNLLKSAGALVILPTAFTDEIAGLCDEVVTLN